MVVIRLSRAGAKGRPFYHIVVTDSQNRRDGRYLERVGFYNPVARGAEEPLRVELARLNHWTGVGAQMSDTVQRLVKQHARQAAPAAAVAA
jgi:small subunit ribosomal protein S16